MTHEEALAAGVAKLKMFPDARIALYAFHYTLENGRPLANAYWRLLYPGNKVKFLQSLPSNNSLFKILLRDEGGPEDIPAPTCREVIGALHEEISNRPLAWAPLLGSLPP